MKEVGQLNGWWSILFRIVMVLTPIFMGLAIGWGQWVTRAIIDNQKAIISINANRWTAKDQQDWQTKHAQDHAELPPKRTEDAINDNQKRIGRLEGFHLK